MIGIYIIYYVCFADEAYYLHGSMDRNTLYEKAQVSCTDHCDCPRDPAYSSAFGNVSKRARKVLGEAPAVWAES